MTMVVIIMVFNLSLNKCYVNRKKDSITVVIVIAVYLWFLIFSLFKVFAYSHNLSAVMPQQVV